MWDLEEMYFFSLSFLVNTSGKVLEETSQQQ